MKPGVTNTDLNSPEKLELEVARILAKRKKRLGGAHTPSPAELRKAHEQDLKHNGNLKKVVLVTEATQTEGDTEKHTSTGHVYGDHKFYSDDYRDRGYYYGPSSSYRDANRNREDFENSRNFRKSNDHRSSYEEKSQNYTPPSMRRAASAHTSPWALKRDMFLDDDVPDFTSTSYVLHRPKSTPYQSANITASILGRHSSSTPSHQASNGSPYKPLSDQITEQIGKNTYYSDQPPANYPTTSPSPFFPNFSPTKLQQIPATNASTPPPPHTHDAQWQPEQLQQQLQHHQQQQPQTQQQEQSQQKSRYQLSPENSDYFDAPKQPAIATTPPIYQSANHAISQSRPLSPLTSSYIVDDNDSVYSESGNEQDDEEYQEQEPYELTIEDHTNVVLTGTELLMVMEKGMQKYHVSVNMPSMTKLVWSERGKVIGSQDLKDVIDVSNLLHAIHPQLDNLQWHTAVSGGLLSKWGNSAWGTLGFSLTVKKSIKGSSRRKKIDFVCSTHEIQQSWVIGLNAIMQSKSQIQNGRKSTSLPFAITNGAGSNEVEKVVAYIDKVMGIDESVVDKVAQLVEQKRRVIQSTSPPRGSTLTKRSSLTVIPTPPAYLTSPSTPLVPSASSPASSLAFPAPPTPTNATSAPTATPFASPPFTSAPVQSEPHAPPTFTRSSTPTLPLVARPPITRSNTTTGVLRASPPGVKSRAPIARASSPLRRSVQL